MTKLAQAPGLGWGDWRLQRGRGEQGTWCQLPNTQSAAVATVLPLCSDTSDPGNKQDRLNISQQPLLTYLASPTPACAVVELGQPDPSPVCLYSSTGCLPEAFSRII